ncbi:MATE family efflux transporter [Sphingomonas suaedae]|uniref:MATE family efflux transporter n=1 Tax=Sphingomonas suaedae TaxID=2599297 RepID=A0A518RIL8_9SPHN|nr:MATE family efflux transporter [Sphingomonas suaedae]QDX27284.1 MATE family efflux transporter [Sphingomonas suaedae]
MPLPADTRAEMRRILALAWPVVLTSLNWTILHVTDVVVVGLVSTHEVAALGASRTLTFIGIVVALGWLTGVLVFASRADGAKDLPATGAVLRQGLVLGTILGLASGGVLYAFALPMLHGVGVEAGIAADAARVVRVMAIAYPFQLLIVAASFFLEGVSRPRRVMAVNLSILPLNAVLAWVLATGQFGLPALGAVGAASATVAATVIGAIAMVVAALTLPRAQERGVRDWSDFGSRAMRQGVGRLLAFGIVPAVASGLELAGFSILIALSTQLGEQVTHAFQIVFSVHNVTFAFALGLGSAAGVRAGNAVGEGVPAEAGPRTAIAAGLAAGVLGLLALPLILIPGWVVSGFPATPEVGALAAMMLAFWAPFILFDGVQVVFVYALRSLGDQVVAGLNGIAAFFLLTGAIGLWTVHHGWGAMGLVWASGSGMIAAAVLNGGRLWWISRRLRLKS